MLKLSRIAFADAGSKYEEASFVIFGVPWDRTSSFRSGAKDAPDEIRKASQNFESFLHGCDLSRIPICDLGNIDTEDGEEEVCSSVRQTVAGIKRDGKIPVMLGGEHSITGMAVGAFEEVKVIVLDAHLDLREKYSGTKFSHACVCRRIIEKVGSKNCMILGVRSFSKEEYEYAKAENLRYYTVEEIPEPEELGKIENVYLSIDMDVVDPAWAPAVSNPEPFGVGPYTIRKIIRAVAKNAVAFDLVEIAPRYDNGETVILAGKLLQEFFCAKFLIS